MEHIKDELIFNENLNSINLSAIFKNDLKKYMQLLFFHKDEVIYSQGNQVNGIYILASGEIKVYFSLTNGKENILRKLKAPRIFGEIEFMVNKPAASSVQVTKDSFCFYLPLKECRNILLKDVFFLKNIAYNLSEAVYKSNIKASINQGLAPKNRVAAYILNNKTEDKFTCDIKDIAEFTGISERHIFRILNEFIQKKFLLKEKYYYLILDKNSLKNLTEDFYFDEK